MQVSQRRLAALGGSRQKGRIMVHNEPPRTWASYGRAVLSECISDIFHNVETPPNAEHCSQRLFPKMPLVVPLSGQTGDPALPIIKCRPK